VFDGPTAIVARFGAAELKQDLTGMNRRFDTFRDEQSWRRGLDDIIAKQGIRSESPDP
jgi:hypothetical protein